MEEGKTGVFFAHQTVEDLVSAVRKFKNSDYDPQYIRQRVLKFDKELFKARIKEYIDNEWKEKNHENLH